MQLSLRARSTTCVVGAAFLIVGLVVACAAGARMFGARFEGVMETAAALRRHTVADMMHDAIRGDVYAAIVASTEHPERKDEIIQANGEHAAEFRKQVDINRRSGLSERAQQAIVGVSDPLEKYISSASLIVETAFTGREKALAMLPDFDARFDELAQAMDAAGDLIEGVTREEADVAARLSRTAELLSYLAVALALPIIGALVYIILRQTLRPLRELEGVMIALAREETEVMVPHTERADEIGVIARAVGVFRSNIIERGRLQEAEAEARQKDLERQKRLNVQVLAFKNEIGAVVSSLSRQVGAMKDVASSLTSTAASASSEATAASEASIGAADNSQAVAAATEELGASIKEIATQAHHATRIVSGATEISSKTNSDVERLAETTESIGSVVELIRKIAEQTNLLALNATIEAVRAGDAGKGFAVVASEVKSLATQTAKATDEISRQIEHVQTSTRAAAAAIKTVSGKFGEINGLTAAIAAAVEEQEAATREIAQNVTTAADRSKSAAGNAGTVTEAAAKTREQAQSVGEVSAQLAKVSEEIEASLGRFVTELASDLKDRRAEWRQPVNRAAVVEADGRRISVRAIEFSLRGIRLSISEELRTGQRVSVDFGDGARRASVMWSNENMVGLEFETAYAEVPMCLAVAQPSARAA